MIKNKKLADKIEARLKIMKEQFGEEYCPCKPNDLVEDNICPCKDARENSHCCCGLYLFEGEDETI